MTQVYIKKCVFLLWILFGIFIGKYIVKYDLNNYLINGVLLIIFSFLFYEIFQNEKFYIDTGIDIGQPHDKNSKEYEKFKIFNKMHILVALYNMILSLIFVFLIIVSIIMMLIHFFN